MNRLWSGNKGARLLAWAGLGLGGFLLVLVAVGCQPSGVINRADFNIKCETDADCVAVLGGDICSCTCNYVAINKSDQDKYEKAREEARNSCGTFGKTCGPCAPLDGQLTCAADGDTKTCTVVK